MIAFKKGDFIRLKNIELHQIDRHSGKSINIFEILDIKDGYVKVHGCKNIIPLLDIDSIPINGKDDFQIYYDPRVSASRVDQNDSAPTRNSGYSYYYEALERNSYQGKNFQELLKENNLKYVHEVQHFLNENFHDNGLKIHTF
ncbi:MAG: hypothetical protein QM800_04165 [Paludibacter sp.]